MRHETCGLHLKRSPDITFPQCFDSLRFRLLRNLRAPRVDESPRGEIGKGRVGSQLCYIRQEGEGTWGGKRLW